MSARPDPAPGQAPNPAPPFFGRMFWLGTLVMAAALTARSCAAPAASPPAGGKEVPGLPLTLDAAYLDRPVEAVATALADARRSMGTAGADSTAIAADLSRADGAVAELQDYYLPLTRTRDAALAAWEDHRTGRNAARDQALAEADIRLSWAVTHARGDQAESANTLLTLLNGVRELDPKDPHFATELASFCRGVQNRLDGAPLAAKPHEDVPAAPDTATAAAAKGAKGSATKVAAEKTTNTKTNTTPKTKAATATAPATVGAGRD